MTILDKLRKMFENTPAAEEKKESLTVEQLHSKLNEKSKDELARDNQLKDQINERIKRFDIELSKSIAELEKINLVKRKENEKVKMVVLENLALYLSQLRRMLGSLKGIESLDTQESLRKMPLILNEFKRASNMPYEKATILIGKEMGENRLIWREFVGDFDKIAAESKELSEEMDKTNKAMLLINELNQNLKQNYELSKQISSGKKEIEEKANEIEKTKKAIDEIRNSEEFKLDIEKKKEHEKKLNDLETEIRQLKSKIDFKTIAKNVHSNPAKAGLLKSYSDNFKHALKNDSELKIKEIITEVDENELLALQAKIVQSNAPLEVKTDIEIENLEIKLRKIESEIVTAKSDIEAGIKRKERISQKQNECKDEIIKIAGLIFPGLEISF